MKNMFVAIKGLIVGATMLVPGVSGGSMAIILGIYNDLIHSMNSLIKNKRKNLLFLLTFMLGGSVGILLFATPISKLIESYPKPMIYFFLGVVAGGVPLIFKQAQVKTFSYKIPLYIAIGFLFVVLLSSLPTNIFQGEIDISITGVAMLVLTGLIAAVALVLPGISITYLLLLMGLYDETIAAISTLYMPFLIPLGIGIFIGILLTINLLERAMRVHTQPTYLVILGFILGSMAEIFPGLPTDKDLIICIIMLICGFAIIRLLSIHEIKKSSE